jgi:predicted anti-sigma-YlaC factor YlaD
MICRRARRALDERSLGRLAPATAAALEDHLRQCPACSSAERADRFIIDELASLRGQVPYSVDVRRRVMIEIDRLGPTAREEVPASQLGWATAVVGLGAIVLLVSLWGSWPEWRVGMENVFALMRGLADVSATLAALLLSLLSLPFKMIAGLRDLWIEVPSVASRVKPFAIVGVALCYLIMASTIVGVVGRDLRHPATTPACED